MGESSSVVRFCAARFLAVAFLYVVSRGQLGAMCKEYLGSLPMADVCPTWQLAVLECEAWGMRRETKVSRTGLGGCCGLKGVEDWCEFEGQP